MVTSVFCQPCCRAGQADFGHARANGHRAADERRPTGRAALLGIIVRERHPFAGDAVDVGCLVSHHAAVVVTDVPSADVVAPDDEDVRLLRLRRSAAGRNKQETNDKCPGYESQPTARCGHVVSPFCVRNYTTNEQSKKLCRRSSIRHDCHPDGKLAGGIDGSPADQASEDEHASLRAFSALRQTRRLLSSVRRRIGKDVIHGQPGIIARPPGGGACVGNVRPRGPGGPKTGWHHAKQEHA